MKKILSLIIITVLCLGLLTGCAQVEDLLGGIIPGFGPDTPDVDVEYNLPRAAEYISTLYKGTPDAEIGKTITQSDFNVVGQCRIAGVPYTVSWATDNELVKANQNEDGSWTIDVTSDSEVAYEYKLTATILAGDGTSTTVEFNFHVQAYILSSFEEYMAAKEGATVTVEGVVVAMNAKSLGNSRNHLFLADANVTGGYYIYQMDQDPIEAGIKIGMTVSVTGPVAPYSGMQEIKGGVATIIDETIAAPFTPIDITEAFKSGASLKNYVGLPVTIKGVTIGGQELGGTSDYLKFSLNGVESYVRTYITDFPTGLQIVVGEDTIVTSPDKTAIDELHASKFGWTANATGILVLYNSNPYLIPMDTNCFEYLEYVELSNEEKIAAELAEITFAGAFNESTVVDLVTSGKYFKEVAIAWASDNDAIAIADGKATITVPDTAVTVNITATITCGDKTETKTFAVKLSKAPITIPEALELADGSNVLVSGTVKEINTAWSDQYGNITVTIVDAEGNTLYVYRMKTNVKVGDVITITGVMGSYNGSKQVAAGSTAVVTDPAPVEVTIPEALELADGRRIIVKGTVKEINTAWSDQYGNITVTIVDAEGNTLYVYRLKTNVNVGDVVTITGKMGTYNNARQVAAGATAVVGEPEAPSAITIPEALELADGADVIVQGTVKKINTAWSDQYGNITVTITDGTNTLYVYRLATKVNEGDLITITGKMGSYNGSKQIAAGATAVIDEAGPVKVTIPEALALDDDTKVIVKGTVSEIKTAWSDQYGNISVTITDGTNTLYVFRLATNVKVGDIVTITGKMGSYNGSKQIAAGATAVITDPNSIEVYAAANGWANSTLYDTITLANGAKVTASGTPVDENDLNTGKFYTSDNTWRIYQNETPSVVITAAEGKTIASVKITYNIKNDGTLTLNGENVASGTVVTVNASSITFSVGNTGTKTNGQAQITAIEVVYA